GPVQDDAVGNVEPGTQQAERQGRVQQDEVDLVLPHRRAHPGQRGRRREEEDGPRDPLDAHTPFRLRRVERGGTFVRGGGQHYVGPRVETLPQVREIVLD